MIVYLAARYSRREELCEHRAWLVAAGATVSSRWLNGDHQVTDGQLLGPDAAEVIEGDRVDDEAVALRQRFAEEDWKDLKDADVVVSFTEPPRSNASRGGRHVEFGAALALNKKCLVVGTRENVFHCLPQVQVYATWNDVSAALARMLLAEEQDRQRDEIRAVAG